VAIQTIIIFLTISISAQYVRVALPLGPQHNESSLATNIVPEEPANQYGQLVLSNEGSNRNAESNYGQSSLALAL
jgi:hypothetical protein